MSRRSDVLAWIRIAGYHEDTKSYTRLLIENRISKSAADEAWDRGIAAKKMGMGCGCLDCKIKDKLPALEGEQ